MKWIFGFLILMLAGALGAYSLQRSPAEEEHSPSQMYHPEDSQEEFRSRQKQEPLTLTLPPEEVKSSILKSQPKIPLEPIARRATSPHSNEESNLVDLSSIPLGVKMDEDNRPMVEFHIQRKSKAAQMADLKNQLEEADNPSLEDN